MEQFVAEREALGCIAWIRDWVEHCSGGAKGIVIGISGGKDSTVAAALCARAVGAHRVFGVLMPNHRQSDIEDSVAVCKAVGIDYRVADIGALFDAALALTCPGDEAKVNLAPRLRMAVLYAIAQTRNYRVCGTGNACERYVGYTTKWGDSASDFNPLAGFTVSEVMALGDWLELPRPLVHKTPSDGLSGLSDEEKMGVTYGEIEARMRGENLSEAKNAAIDRLHRLAEHKVNPVPTYLSITT
ncbi:MAG: NAD(+) synthase [Angelakisella sp.]